MWPTLTGTWLRASWREILLSTTAAQNLTLVSSDPVTVGCWNVSLSRSGSHPAPEEEKRGVLGEKHHPQLSHHLRLSPGRPHTCLSSPAKTSRAEPDDPPGVGDGTPSPASSLPPQHHHLPEHPPADTPPHSNHHHDQPQPLLSQHAKRPQDYQDSWPRLPGHTFLHIHRPLLPQHSSSANIVRDSLYEIH